ncbi:MAG TPA: hypothetical protein VEX38_08815, partial [Fimbriimonadaceae bacterium]|nr:hypothetical protein [Fimbriimonadaceae bacterium]
ISSVSVTPNNVTGGQSTTGTITLDGPAPNGGLTATLTAGSSAIQVPQTVEILPGAATADFTVNTSAVGAIFTRPIFASMFGTTRSTNLTLRPAIRLDSLTVDPSTVNGGQNTTGTVRLNTTAPTNGIIVHLSSNSSALVVPSNVLVPEGLNQATFTIETRNVGATSVRTVTATYDGVSRSANVTINPSANLSTFIISPNTVNGGDRTTGTVTLDRPAGAEGVEVTLQSQSSIIIVPATVMIPSGQSQASFQITTLDVSATATRYVVATRGASSRSAALTVNPGAVLNRVEVNPATVKGGTNTTGTVHLTRAAPAGGAVVYLQSGSSALQVPATVNVAQGQTSATFTITTSRVGATVTRYITATRGVSRQVAVTLTP